MTHMIKRAFLLAVPLALAGCYTAPPYCDVSWQNAYKTGVIHLPDPAPDLGTTHASPVPVAAPAPVAQPAPLPPLLPILDPAPVPPMQPRPVPNAAFTAAEATAVSNDNTGASTPAKKHTARRPSERGVRYYGSPTNTKAGKSQGTAKKVVNVP